ncbi:glycosyltransferase family 4 protein [Flavobacterium ardleyense]|uniref:glycosyltransferase family 4 protein n=1 Tax=Flavobacterium ardleyense TaxID=2038737 RepID=UPI00298D4482|nr:glycosyltransferase family 4 protein [Flavobacterium ardleyense]
MKKLIVGITIPGSVGLLEGQLSYFKEKGFDTYLMAPKDEKSLAYCARENCKLLEITIAREISLLSDLKTVFQIIKILKAVKPDIVNFGTPKISLLGLLAAKYCGIKHRIFTCRGFRFEHEQGFLQALLKRMDAITSYCADTIICISPSVKELGIRENIFDEKKCVIINKGSSNGLDLTKFNPTLVSQDAKTQLRKQLNISESNFVYGFLGRIIDRKGINELYKAFCELYNSDNNKRLLIVGPFDQGQIKDKDLFEKLSNHAGIVMPGRTDEVALFLSLMDVFVLPAWWEGFGNVLVQAAAMGLPVISTFGTGTRDAVSDGYNGILVSVKNVPELITAMDELYSNETKRNTLGSNGVLWSKNFKNEIIWNGMLDIYNK